MLPTLQLNGVKKYKLEPCCLGHAYVKWVFRSLTVAFNSYFDVFIKFN